MNDTSYRTHVYSSMLVPPQVSLQASATHAPSMIVITCGALNGTPDAHNITLMKSGLVIAGIVGGNTLTHNVPVTCNGLGQYVCVVDSFYTTQQMTLVLSGSGMCSHMHQLIFWSEYHL